MDSLHADCWILVVQFAFWPWYNLHSDWGILCPSTIYILTVRLLVHV